MGGRLMKEWFQVRGTSALWAPLAREALAFVEAESQAARERDAR